MSLSKNSIGENVSASRLRSAIYVSGNYGKSILWTTLEIFFIFYLTDILGVPPAMAGVIVIITVLWDAILDPLFGALIDTLKTPFGKYGFFILIGAPLSGLTFILAFTLPTVLQSHKVPALIACIMLFRVFSTITDISHTSLMARIFHTSRTRAHIAQLRYLFNALASLSIAVATAYIFAGETPSEQADNFRQFAILSVLVGTPLIWASWISIARYDRALPRVNLRPQMRYKLFTLSFGSKDALVLLAIAFWTAMTLPTFTKSISYFAKYVLNDDALIAYGLAASVIGKIIGTPFWGFLAAKFEKSTTHILAHCLAFMTLGFFYITAGNSHIMFCVSSAVVGFSLSGVFSLYWGMAPDVIDKLHLSAGVRPEATFYSTLTFVIKIGTAIGAFLLGLLLAIIGFEANVVQEAKTLNAILLVMTVIPAIGTVGCVLLLKQYSISHDAHAIIRERLDKKQHDE